MSAPTEMFSLPLVHNKKARHILRNVTFTLSNSRQAEEHDMFRSKPTVGSVCGRMCGGLPTPHEHHPLKRCHPITLR